MKIKYAVAVAAALLAVQAQAADASHTELKDCAMAFPSFSEGSCCTSSL